MGIRVAFPNEIVRPTILVATAESAGEEKDLEETAMDLDKATADTTRRKRKKDVERAETKKQTQQSSSVFYCFPCTCARTLRSIHQGFQ